MYIYICVLYVYKDAYTFIYKYDYMQFLTKPKQLEVLDLACASVQVWRSEVWMGDVVGDVVLGVMLPWRLRGVVVLV